MCRNCNLSENYVVIDSEFEGKVKRAWADNIPKEIKDNSVKAEDHWMLIVPFVTCHQIPSLNKIITMKKN